MNNQELAMRLAMAYTTDLDEAMSLFEQLPVDKALHCQLSFPAEWVIARSTEALPRALWAIKHCDDPVALAQVAAQPKLRARVHEALVSNPHTPSSALSAPPVPKPRPMKEVPEREALVRSLRTILGHGNARLLDEYGPALNILDRLAQLGDSDHVDAVIERFVSADSPRPVTALYAVRLFPGSVSQREALLAGSRLDPQALLSRLSRGTAQVAMESVIRRVLSSDTPPSRRLTLPDVVVLASPAPTSVPTPVPTVPAAGRLSNDEWLAPDALDAVVHQLPVEWAVTLHLSQLADQDRKDLFARAASYQRLELFSEEHNASIVPSYADLIIRDLCAAAMGDRPAARLFAALVPSLDRARYEVLVRELSPDLLRNLICGTPANRPNPRTLTDEYLTLAIERLSANKLAGSMILFRQVEDYAPDSSLRALLRLLPGLARIHLANFKLGRSSRFIYEDLGTCPSLPIAVDMLMSHPDASLSEVVRASRELAM